MAALLPDGVFLARHGGDEFAVLAPGGLDPAGFLEAALAAPFAVPGAAPVRIGFTIAGAPVVADLDRALLAASAALRAVRTGDGD
jgi:GGDEF domain-containing protein